MNPYVKLIEVASFYVGVSEQVGRPNGGPNIEEFQKAFDGKAQGEPWCAAFVAFCLKKVASETGRPLKLVLSEHVMTMWRENIAQRANFAKPGYLAIWQHGTTSSGHIGIVEWVEAGNIFTIEGNTGPDSKTIVREGDGVFRKTRPLTDVGKMVLLGFIDPWG